MHRVLIVYGTTEGQTRKIAEFLAEESKAHGYLPTLYDAANMPPDIDPSHFDRVIVAASVNMDRHQADVRHFIQRVLPSLRTMRSAFLSVSLSAAGDAEDRYVAWEDMRRFLSDNEWRPAETEIVPGALRFTEHDFFKRWAMKRVATAKRVPRDTTCDYEYTDWEALGRFLKRFLGPSLGS